MRRNSLSSNQEGTTSAAMTSHSHPASAVLKPPTPEEAREMARNLRSRKMKLISKHLRQSRVISFGLIVVLTCLLSAGAIELYLRCFLPAPPERFFVPSPRSNRNNSGKPQVKPQVQVNLPEKDKNEKNENSSEINSKPQTDNNVPASRNNNKDTEEPEVIIDAPVSDSPVEESECESESEGEPLPYSGPGLSSPGLSAPGHSSPGLVVPGSAPASSLPVEPAPVVKTKTTFPTPSTPLIDFSNDFFNGFVEFEEVEVRAQIMEIKYFDYSDKFTIIVSPDAGQLRSTDIMNSFVPFTFKDNVKRSLPKAYKHIIGTFPLILKSPLLAEVTSTELHNWITHLRTETAMKSFSLARLNEFTDFWATLCQTVHHHPLYSPLIKAQTPAAVTPDALDLLSFFGVSVKGTATVLPRLAPVTGQELTSLEQQLSLAGTIAHLTPILSALERLVYGPDVNYTALISHFEACHLKDGRKNLVDPVVCANLYIQYYNQLTERITPPDKAEALKAFNKTEL